MNPIIQTAIDAGIFSSLVSAVQAAGLVDALSGEGPFTVFAPTDEAFANLPEGALDSLLQDPEELKRVLTYHVVSGKVMASDVADLTEATTLEGSTLSIDTDENGVMINGANVVQADIECTNGVIHVIDSVLMPL